jgi:hypothetical protein
MKLAEIQCSGQVGDIQSYDGGNILLEGEIGF